MHLYPRRPSQKEINYAVSKEGVHIKGDNFEAEPSHPVTGVRLLMNPPSKDILVDTKQDRERKEMLEQIYNLSLAMGEEMIVSEQKNPTEYLYLQGMYDIAALTDTWATPPFSTHPRVVNAKQTALVGCMDLCVALGDYGIPQM